MRVVMLIELYFNRKLIRRLFIQPWNKRINVWGNQRRRKLAMAFLQKPDKWCVHMPCPASVSGCGGVHVKPSLTSLMCFTVIYRKVSVPIPYVLINTVRGLRMLLNRKALFFFGKSTCNHWILPCFSETEQSSYKLW